MSGEVLTDRIRTAAKPHSCGWCGQQIEPGERYRDLRIAGDGTMHIWKNHPACDARVDAYARDLGLLDDDWDHIEWGYVLEWEAERAEAR